MEIGWIAGSISLVVFAYAAALMAITTRAIYRNLANVPALPYQLDVRIIDKDKSH